MTEKIYIKNSISELGGLSTDPTIKVLLYKETFTKTDSIGANGESLDYKFDVICLSEIYLKQGEKADYYFPNYTIFYPGRSNRTGGGVVICIADQFDWELICPLTVTLPHIQ